MQELIVAFFLSAVLLPSLLLRYLPFRQFITQKQKNSSLTPMVRGLCCFFSLIIICCLPMAF